MGILNKLYKKDKDYDFFWQIEDLLEHRQEKIRKKAKALVWNCKRLRELIQEMPLEIMEQMPGEWRKKADEALKFWSRV